MSLERRLATLNISQSRVPVPPPRYKRTQKRMTSVPDDMGSSPAMTSEMYGERSYSFDSDTHYKYDDRMKHDDYEQACRKETYHKYEVIRKREDLEQAPMCDIIQSSQSSYQSRQMRRPDILRGSFNADLQSKLAESSLKSAKPLDTKSNHRVKDKGRTSTKPDQDTIRYKPDKESKSKHKSDKNSSKNSTSRQDTQRSPSKQFSRHDTETDLRHMPRLIQSSHNGENNTSNNRFMFYRPRLEKLAKPHSAIGLVNMDKSPRADHNLGGSFVNPAFDIVDTPTKDVVTPRPIKAVATPSRPVYSTMGSSFSTRPCTPSPPSSRFRNNKPPLPTSPEPVTNLPPKARGPQPMRPLISPKQLETSLKQYSSTTKLNTSDMCSPQALESMMKYYNIDSSKDKSLSESLTPPPAKLSSSKKNQSPYSSTNSLNVSGESIDVVLRRKKKVSLANGRVIIGCSSATKAIK